MATKSKHLVLKAGLGIAAAAAAAGAYYFFGKDGAKRRKSAHLWVSRAKKDVLAEVKKLKAVNQRSYDAVAAKVMQKYEEFQKKNPEVYSLLAKELKSNWKKIARHLPTTVRKIVSPKGRARKKISVPR